MYDKDYLCVTTTVFYFMYVCTYSCEGSPHKDPLLSVANGDSPRLQNSGDIVYFYQGTHKAVLYYMYNVMY